MEENENSLFDGGFDTQPVSERDLPFNMEAEQAVLGSALTDSESVGEAAQILSPEDFYFSANKFIFEAVMDLFNTNSPIDFVTITEQLKLNNKLDAVGGIEYLKRLATSVPTTQHVKYYSDIIREKSILRTLIRKAEKISEMAQGEGKSLSQVIESSEQMIFDVSSSNEQKDIIQISDVLHSAYVQMARNAENKGGITGLSTGFDELNKRTGGFHAGELIFLAGRPGMG